VETKFCVYADEADHVVKFNCLKALFKDSTSDADCATGSGLYISLTGSEDDYGNKICSSTDPQVVNGAQSTGQLLIFKVAQGATIPALASMNGNNVLEYNYQSVAP